MTDRQDVEAAAERAGWRADSTGSGKGVALYVSAGEGERELEVRYDGSGALSEVWLDDRQLGDAATVGLAALTVSLLSGKAPKRSGEPDTNQPWDPSTGGPLGQLLEPLVAAPPERRPRGAGGRARAPRP